jgi:hypothetical protein
MHSSFVLPHIPKRNKQRTVFLLEPEKREALALLSAQSGESLGELLRKSVDYWLTEQSKQASA